MKSSAAVLKTLYGRRRWHAAHERAQRAAPHALRDYIELLRPTAESLVEALCVVDLAGCIHYANSSALRLLGRDTSSALGVSIHDLLRSAAEPHAPLAELVALAEGEELTPCLLWRPDGTSAPVGCALQRVAHEGRALGATLLLTEHVAGVAGAAMREGALERRMRTLDAVSDIALAQLPLDSLLKALLDSLRGELELENIAIFLVNDDGETLSARMASGAGAEVADRIRLPLAETIVGRALLDRRAIYIPDVAQVADDWIHFSPEIRAHMNVQSFIITPLVVEDRLIGGIYIGANRPNGLSAEDARLAELIGGRAALAIERARVSDEAARAHERLRFLNDASGALNETLDYRDATRRLAAILSPALADACAIYLLEDDGLLRRVATQAPILGLLSANPYGIALRRLVERMDAMEVINPDDADNPIAECVRSLAPVFERQTLAELAELTELTELAEQQGAPTAPADAVACLCVSAPLVVRQHALGALYLTLRSGKTLSDGDLALIQGLAERAAIAIDNARLYSETQQALATGSATATQLDAIFNATDVGIFVTDADGGFLRINPYGRRLLGMEHIALQQAPAHVGGPFQLRTTEGDEIPADREPLQLARMLGQPIEQRFVIHRFDTGKDIQALTRCTPWRNDRNQIAGAIAVVADISAIYELERQKDEFLGIASHELKTPLTSLKILAQLLVRRMEASGEPRDIEQARRMQVAITRMENLIRDLLDVTLIQEGKLPLRRDNVDLNVLCAEAINEQRLLTQRVIHYSAPDDAHLIVYADRDRIYQALTNLLSNALKYSAASQPVTVRARATPLECIVSVHDHGPGVPQEAQDLIFDRFYRVPGMQVQSGSGVGLGLGLHISKDIISRHGGRLWVESKLGHGSTFSLALPRAHPSPLPAGEGAEG